MPGYHNHLLHLTYIRVVTLFGLSAALLFAIFVLHAQIGTGLTVATLCIMALINLITYARLHSSWPVTESELFTQLTADAVLYGALIYQTGGATNPFIFLLLIPLIISAATLSWRFTWLMALVVVLLYSSLMNHYIPILTFTGHRQTLMDLFNLHLTGMWLNFLLTVLLITWFIVRMQQTMREQEQRLVRERERRIQDQQLLALATMAAGTAHELGTPLSTMSVVLREMALDHPDQEELNEDIQLLQQQVNACSERLKQMASSVRDAQQSRQQVVTELLDEVINEWQLMRPEVSFDVEIGQHDSPPSITTTLALQQALMNLLNNAADAAPENIRIQLDWDPNQVWLRIHDQGPGLPLEQSADLGKPFVTTKGKGLGIGLFLTATTLAQRDGEVRLYNHPQGGTLTEVRLPIRSDTSKESL